MVMQNVRETPFPSETQVDRKKINLSPEALVT